jgi:hypothetical protein
MDAAKIFHQTRTIQGDHQVMKRIYVVALICGLLQVSCVAVGYSSNGGWFFWPGGLTLVVIIAVVLLLSRRRRG